MQPQTHGVRKYPPTSALLASSAGLGWTTISVELRAHGVIEAPAIVPQHVEICLVIAGNGIGDDVIDQIGRSILSELNVETGASRMYVEAASLTLAARLLQKYCDSGACAPAESSAHKLDHIRLRRVLDYIAANIEDDITLADLARIAGYSPFHFARKFTLAMGIAPQRYISRVRMENAMSELAAGKLPLAEIALNAQFSSQASFTRAFHRSTGMTPKEYQRSRR